jgi:hypothetical protein
MGRGGRELYVARSLPCPRPRQGDKYLRWMGPNTPVCQILFAPWSVSVQASGFMSCQGGILQGAPSACVQEHMLLGSAEALFVCWAMALATQLPGTSPSKQRLAYCYLETTGHATGHSQRLKGP